MSSVTCSLSKANGDRVSEEFHQPLLLSKLSFDEINIPLDQYVRHLIKYFEINQDKLE